MDSIKRWFVAVLGLHSLAQVVLLCGLVFTTAIAQETPQSNRESAEKNILLLYSYGHGGKGVGVFDEGLLATLSDGGIQTTNLFFEYLDLERHSFDPLYPARLHELFQKKYASRQIDLVLTVQQPARNWILSEAGRDIAPNAPVIAVQAPMPTAKEVGGRRVVSVLTNFDIKGTVSKALDLLPSTRRIFLVAGRSDADKKVATSALQILESFKEKVEVEESGDMPLDALLKHVANMPPQTIILFTQYNRDSAGKVTIAYEVERMLVKAANAPVFGLYDFNLRNGGIGGSVVSVKGLGEKTGQLMLDLLSGKFQISQPVTRLDMNVVAMFDWKQVRRWGSDPSRLPPDTIIVNRELTFWEQYGWYLVIGIVFIAAQSLLIAALVVNRQRRRLTEKTLEESEQRYRTAFMVSPDAINITRLRDGLYLNVNEGFTRTMGWTSDEAVGRTSVELNLWANAEDRQRIVAAVNRDGHCKNMEAHFVAKDGHVSTGLMSAQLMTINGEQCLLSVTRDITERKQFEIMLAHEKALMEAIFNSIPDGIVYVNVDREIIRINPAFESIFGFDLEDLAGKTTSYFYESQAEYEMQGKIRFNASAADQSHPYEVKYRKKSGVVFQGETLGTVIKDSSGGVLGFIGVIRDITERKAVQDKMQLAANVFSHAREGIAIADATGNIIDVNATFSDITGYSRDDVIGQNPRILSSGRQGPEFYADLWRNLEVKGHWYGEIWNRRKNGEVYAEMLTISAVRDPHGVTQNYVALFSDITAIKEHQSQLEHIAHFDALTNLPNRLLLADRLQQAMAQTQRRGQQLAVVYLDLDEFKGVNDRHGHDVGDQLLIHLATAMKDTLREGDTLARIGGDEFVAVLTDLDGIENCVPMVTRLLGAASAPVQFAALALQSSASIGVTFYPQANEMESDQLLRQADQSMYQAKLAGKNRYHIFDSDYDSSMRVHHESLEHIRQALDRREFVLHYQPKVNMRSGQVMGAEALIRWQHPEKGLLAPATFLPVIEDHPLAVEVGEWVIDTALTQIEVWHAIGLDLAVSVNIGARQLQQGNFMERLQTILAKHPQVMPSRLELEVLETSALSDMAQVSQVIEACTQIGVKFALDDFGTGYSSLTYLKRLRVTLLKIDQSFVRDMLEDPDDLAILQGVIGLAAAFKREVIAEGVETVAHGTALLRLGCELAQGYGIARPMPPEQLPAWAATWRPDAAWCAVLNSGEGSRSTEA